MGVIADRYARRAQSFQQVIEHIAEPDWGTPTPCPEWSARDVVRHVVLLHEMVLRSVGRRSGAGPSPEADPVAAFRRASNEIQQVLADQTAPQTEFARWVDSVVSNDLVMHRWDLARACGQDDTIDPADVALLWPGTARAPAGIDARSDQARLLGLTGRDPNWSLPSPRAPSE